MNDKNINIQAECYGIITSLFYNLNVTIGTCVQPTISIY